MYVPGAAVDSRTTWSLPFLTLNGAQHRRRLMKDKVAVVLVLVAFASISGAQTWTPLTNQPGVPVGTALLLTDGSVMAQQLTNDGFGTSSWWKLTPDANGSYINGTWTQLASMPSGYAPLWYASAVLPDGRVLVEGGEYNGTSQVWTNQGAIYDPAGDVWTPVAPPSGWSNIGDAQSVILSNGTLMLANAVTSQEALFNAATLSWTPTGSNKADGNDEEGWTLLPNGKVLTVDAVDLLNSELYDPSTGSWSTAGSTIVQLPQSTSEEIGPAVLRPDGTVFATGGTSNTAIYNLTTGGWSVGPTFPSGLDIADGPAALLPSGNVLVDASPGVFQCCYQFFEFNGTSLLSVPSPQHHTIFDVPTSSFEGRMLVLPTGQVMFTDGATVANSGGFQFKGPASVQVYSGAGVARVEWQPTISSAPATLILGSYNNLVSGTQFNGLSQGAAYGDDVQSATNYPLVRVINNSTGHVKYLKTHDHSTMGVATGNSPVSTLADLSTLIETGLSTLQVVANGIASNGVTVQVASTGNPFIYRTPRDQQLACFGISVAPNFPSNCRDISDPDDRQMCYGMSQNSQDPCKTIKDRNLQLACFGMSVAPNFPSNCNSITDPQLQNFCFGVSSSGSMGNCSNLTDANARAECQGISLHNSSFCSSIGNNNDRLFCQGIATRSQSPCTSIQ
jgi:hypothetical protein